MTPGDVALVLMVYGLLLPIPLLALLAVMRQRSGLRAERARYADLIRISRGRR